MSAWPPPARLRRSTRPRAALALAPATSRGWFGGRALTARDPLEYIPRCDLRAAARALEMTFSGERGGLTAALLTYEGIARVAHYDRVSDVAWARAPGVDDAVSLLADPVFDLDRDAYRAAVCAVRERIAAGDVYVLNLTGRLAGRPVLSPRETFDALVTRGGGDMSAFFGGCDDDEGTIASISPERFVRIADTGDGRSIEVWPIKGTRARGVDRVGDQALAAELRADDKERAEHVMVVDLERNDIGRVALAGTVVVRPLMEIVPTPYCHQMVSAVRGVLSPDVRLADVLESVFPCGSVTGAPKRAAMEIITELETGARETYCGALMVAVPGEIDSSVLIRTLEWTAPDRAVWGTGCGITYDSDPEAEWRELLLKASPVLGHGSSMGYTSIHTDTHSVL